MIKAVHISSQPHHTKYSTEVPLTNPAPFFVEESATKILDLIAKDPADSASQSSKPVDFPTAQRRH